MHLVFDTDVVAEEDGVMKAHDGVTEKGVVEVHGMVDEHGIAEEDNTRHEFDVAQAMMTLGGFQTELVQLILHWEVEKIKAWSCSRNCTNDPVIVTVFVGLRGYMYNPIT